MRAVPILSPVASVLEVEATAMAQAPKPPPSDRHRHSSRAEPRQIAAGTVVEQLLEDTPTTHSLRAAAPPLAQARAAAATIRKPPSPSGPSAQAAVGFKTLPLAAMPGLTLHVISRQLWLPIVPLAASSNDTKQALRDTTVTSHWRPQFDAFWPR